MRRGCRVECFGRALTPIRDNFDEAQLDAIRLKLGSVDEYGRFFLDAGAEFQWVPIEGTPVCLDRHATQVVRSDQHGHNAPYDVERLRA